MPRRTLLLLCVLSNAARAQAHDMSMHDQLGTVHFATSCAPGVAPTFDHAIALLHSFEFSQAIRGFNDVLAKDPNCAMADWGIALARWGNPMNASQRATGQLEAGRQAAAAAVRLAQNATPRE